MFRNLARRWDVEEGFFICTIGARSFFAAHLGLREARHSFIAGADEDDATLEHMLLMLYGQSAVSVGR